MFTHVYIQNIRQYPNRQVTLKGWVAARQMMGEAMFLDLRDGTGTIRCIVSKKELPPAQWAAAEKLTSESAVSVTGKTVDDGGKSIHGNEIRVSALEVLSLAPLIVPADLPSRRHLWIRTPEGQALLRIRNAAHKAVVDYFDWSGFAHVDAQGTPEAGVLATAAFALGKVYSITPSVGAGREHQRTILVETAFITVDEAMSVAEDFLSYLVHRLSTEQANDLRTLKRNPVPLNFVKKPFPRLDYSEAAAMASKEGITAKGPLGREALAAISRKHDRPVFIHRPPVSSWFAARAEEAELSFAILAPEGFGRIGTGWARETDPAAIEQRLREAKLRPEPYFPLLDACRHGATPVAGFGVGLEDFLSWLCGLDSSSSAVPFS